MVQTTKANVLFPDGAKVQVKDKSTLVLTDIGALNSAINLSLDYEENEVITANAGDMPKQIRSMTIAGSFTLVNFEIDVISKLGGGLFEKVVTAASSVTSIDDQVIAAGWVDKSIIPLEVVETSGSALKLSAVPVVASVTGASTGALAANDDYTIAPYSDSTSGYAIILNTAGSAGVATTEIITVAFTSAIPVASEAIYAGTSTKILVAYGLLVTHTDENGKTREFEIYSADANSGGFQFNFKGANEDGIEEMPVTFKGRLDTDLTDGRQLMRYAIEDGAL